MKLKLLYLSLLLLAFASSCNNNNYTPPAPPSSLQGSFTGQFSRIHIPLNSNKTDTQTANIQLIMQANSTYKVQGDTTTLHAGSHGSFSLSANSGIQFFDTTFPISGTPTKVHLSGIYTYSYDGVVLRINGSGPLDTLVYQYDLRKD